MTKQFKGVIKLDVRDSKPDWTPYDVAEGAEGRSERPDRAVRRHRPGRVVAVRRAHQHADAAKARRQRPEVLAVAHDRALLADALDVSDGAQPPRESLRVDHGGARTDSPARRVVCPPSARRSVRCCRTTATARSGSARTTTCRWKTSPSGGSRSEWPLQKGFDRFYGFLGGETNNWYPDLVEDNHFIDQPDTPEHGYHLSKDLADQAIRMLRDQQSSNPSKPWFMWFCPGANHAPHHSPKDTPTSTRASSTTATRRTASGCCAQMIEKGIMPKDTALTPINPMPKDVADTAPGDIVRPWNTLNADEKKLFARMAEVYAGFSEYTDAQVGRIVDYLENTNQLDNTIIFYCADNGASGEGSPNGSVNENKFFNGYPDDLAENLKYLDKLGGPDTYNHYPTGWAVAFSTPFQMFKRYSQYSGGTCDPLVIHWPKGIKAKGEVRHQYHHSTDIVPTILEVAGSRCRRCIAASSSIR